MTHFVVYSGCLGPALLRESAVEVYLRHARQLANKCIALIYELTGRHVDGAWNVASLVFACDKLTMTFTIQQP